MYKIASWNVNSVRARIEPVVEWIRDYQPDILAIQETKVEKELFPKEIFEDLGYYVSVVGQKSYNGVATISREPLQDILSHWPDHLNTDNEQRLLVGTAGKLRIVNVYVPNGQSVDSEKYVYKLGWLERFHAFIKEELTRYPEIVILGDFNIAPADEDVYDPKAWEGNVLVSEPERSALQKLLRLGFKDSFRLFDQPKEQYSWWNYRAAAFRRNMGLRIDLVLISNALIPRCTASEIDKAPRGKEKPSDHAPVWVALD